MYLGASRDHKIKITYSKLSNDLVQIAGQNVNRQNVENLGLLEMDKTWIPKPNGPPNNDHQRSRENFLDHSRACGNPALILGPKVHPDPC